MPHYRITRRDDDFAEVYWVLANTEEHARRLVSLNPEGARRPRLRTREGGLGTDRERHEVQ